MFHYIGGVGMGTLRRIEELPSFHLSWDIVPLLQGPQYLNHEAIFEILVPLVAMG
jgi:hypothetical protein